MVRVTSFQKRTSKDGNEFFVLELQSDKLEFVVSKVSGRKYATTAKCYMPSSFDEETCIMMKGKTLPGEIKKVECEAYTFTIEETGEEITRSYRYDYFDDVSPEEAVFDSEFNKELA